jgi:peroxiredoxin/mono/diheme cytochrome c family protein
MSLRNASRAAMLLALGLAAGEAARGDEEAPIGRGVGQRVANFTLPDVTTGREVSLLGLARDGTKAAVLVFTGIDCPVGNLYMPRLVELSHAYKDKGVAFLAINSNAHETAEQVAEHAKQFHLDFPVLKDKGNAVADQLLAQRTCEAVVIDRLGRIRYRGAIDDQYGPGTRREKPTKSYLVEALDALLAGKEIDTTATTVAGCPLDRVEAKVARSKAPRVRPAPPAVVEALKAKEEPVQVGKVTYAADVAAILQNKCQSCHRPRQAAPFSLLSYDDARRWATTIREVVEDRRMPPWHADPRFGHFANDRSLSARERATLLAWVDQGAPLGDPKDLPAPKSWPEGWSVGQPDVVLSMAEPYTVPAQGTVAYQYFRVPTNFHEDKWVQSIECRPGDPAVVHHIIAYLLPKERDPAERRRGPGEHLGGYAPGDLPSVYPPGVAKKIPAGSTLLFQVHYTPMGKIRTDRSSVGLIFAKTPPTRRAITHGIANQRFQIPPGDSNTEVESRFVFGRDAELLSFMPHMHLRGKDFKYTATFPDGRSEVLLSVPAYDFGWQSYYHLDRPKTMPKGTRIDCVAHFDNSEENPNNPDPKATVRWGEQTWEEMMIGYIDYTLPIDPPGSSPATKAAAAPASPPLRRALLGLLRGQATNVNTASRPR